MSMEKFRIESDLLGSKEVPADALYGVQTVRAIENFNISGNLMSSYPNFIKGMAITKKAAAIANYELEMISREQFEAICQACDELLEGKHHDQFPIDMIQGGAGTSTNMCANEVIANRALEIMGHKRGEYRYCSPNDIVNASQSTNDAYPCAIQLAMVLEHEAFLPHLVDMTRQLYVANCRPLTWQLASFSSSIWEQQPSEQVSAQNQAIVAHVSTHYAK